MVDWNKHAQAVRLSRDGDPAQHIYFVLEGAVRVFYSATATRGSMTIKLFGAPSSFGDAECVLGTTYAENVQAIVHSLILAVGGHYTYAKVPIGDWARDMFHFAPFVKHPSRR